jgi:predicted metal-dependent peptidase
VAVAADPKIRRDALESKCAVTPEDRELALQIFEEAKQDLTLAEPVLAARIIRMCMPVVVDGNVVDTFAISYDALGVFLMINAKFAMAIGRSGSARVLAHEAYHDVYLHLKGDGADQDHLRKHSYEIVINHAYQLNPSLKGMPMITNDQGKQEEVGVNPQKEWQKYKDDLKGQGKQFCTYEEFVSSDERCYSELQRMAKPPKPPKNYSCSHQNGQAGHGDVSIDPDVLDEAVGGAIRKVIEQARAGDENARKEIERLADMTGDSEEASKLWGDYGLGALRGEAVQPRKTAYWKRWLSRVVGSRLQPGMKLKQNRRLVAVDLLLGRDPQLGWIGDEERKRFACYIDTSGSMYGPALDHIREVVGVMDGVDANYYNFDCDVYDVVYGESFKGGGGTSFEIIDQHVQTMTEIPDVILVVTDGYASHVLPKHAEKYIWLITPGGDTWPQQYGMECEEIDLEEMSA